MKRRASISLGTVAGIGAAAMFWASAPLAKWLARDVRPRPLAGFDQANRATAARSLSAARRLEILDSLVRGQPRTSTRVARGNPQLLGIYRFQVWLTDSGRMADDGGSPWWREINGLLLFDVIESTTANPTSSGAVAAWATYWNQRSRSMRTRGCWNAHQSSLHAAAQTANDAFALETEAEQLFIAIALESVDLAAGANLPTGRVGSPIIGGFCRAFYPDSYPAGDRAGAEGHAVLGQTSNQRRVGAKIAAAVARRHLPGWTARHH